MSTLDPTLDHNVGATGSEIDATSAEAPATPAIVAVLTSSDHKVIGRLIISSALLAALATGALGVLLGIERIDGDGTLLATRVLPELFAGYRVGLVLGALVPLALGVCVVAVPLQIGARSLAFPRVAAAGFWTWLGGIALLIVSLFNNGGPGGGDADMVRLYVAATGLMVVGLTAIAATVATSVLSTRAPGMRLHRVPLFSWSALVFSLGLVLVLPVLLGVIVYLYLDTRYATADTTLFGGAAGINDWASWLLTGPSLALFAVPAVGFVGELIPLVFRKRLPMRGVALAGIALVGIGALAGVMQQREIVLPGTGTEVNGHNWITKLGILVDWGIMTLLPALGAVVVLGLGAMLAKPPSRAERRAGTATTPRLIAPFLFAFFGVAFILIGILGAATNGIEDLGLVGTVFEEGATVALAYGTILSTLGAVAYWSPKWSGHKLPDLPLYGLALLGALGALLASVPYLIAGFADQPGSAVVYSYEGPSELWNTLVMIGHGIFAVAVLATIGLVLKPSGQAAAGDDPWDGHTLEWATTSPAPAANFATTPVVRSAEPLLDLKVAAATGSSGGPE